MPLPAGSRKVPSPSRERVRVRVRPHPQGAPSPSHDAFGPHPGPLPRGEGIWAVALSEAEGPKTAHSISAAEIPQSLRSLGMTMLGRERSLEGGG